MKAVNLYQARHKLRHYWRTDYSCVGANSLIDIAGFLVAIIPIALSPGASFTLAMSNASIAGMRGTLSVIIGTAVGILIHGGLVGLGISSFIVKSPLAMQILRWIGVLFLGWLGVKLVIAGLSALKHKSRLNRTLAGFKDALVLNLFNAKAVILYLTVVPIFAGTQMSHYLLLSLVHIAVMASWIVLAALLIKAANKVIELNVLSGLISLAGGGFLIIVTCVTALKLSH